MVNGRYIELLRCFQEQHSQACGFAVTLRVETDPINSQVTAFGYLT